MNVIKHNVTKFINQQTSVASTVHELKLSLVGVGVRLVSVFTKNFEDTALHFHLSYLCIFSIKIKSVIKYSHLDLRNSV